MKTTDNFPCPACQSPHTRHEQADRHQCQTCGRPDVGLAPRCHSGTKAAAKQTQNGVKLPKAPCHAREKFQPNPISKGAGAAGGHAGAGVTLSAQDSLGRERDTLLTTSSGTGGRGQPEFCPASVVTSVVGGDGLSGMDLPLKLLNIGGHGVSASAVWLCKSLF